MFSDEESKLDNRTGSSTIHGTDSSLPSSKGNSAVHEISDVQENAYEVFWAEPSDRDLENPMNWSTRRKSCNIAMVAFLTFLTPLASSMFAPGVPQVMIEFRSQSDTLASFVVAVYVLGFAFGPLLVAPISELKGRLVVYHTCNVLFCVFTVLNAVSKNMQMLIVFRFFAGVAGVAPITIGSGTIADLIPRERRGLVMSLWSFGPIMGPVIGPILGGVVTQSLGWRWVFWLLSIVSGVATVSAFAVLSETFPPAILERKAAKLRKTTGDPRYISRLKPEASSKAVFINGILRPTKMLIFSPIVAMLSIYIAVLYGLLYILFTTFTFVYEDIYHFSTSSAGLAFIGSGVGTTIGLIASAKFSDLRIRKRIAASEVPQPEDRLPAYLVLPASTTVPIGLFVYGWSAQKHMHWIVPQVGNAITGAGMIVIVMSVQTYLVDAFTLHAASAIAANTVLRSLLGALLPLGGLHLYDAIGFGWGNSLLGFIALGLVPIPVLLGIYGERVRNAKRGQVKF